jgi:hypothetical protein
MVDFYSALARKIQQVQEDPARMREVVYEAARLALRWQVAEHGSLSNLGDSRRLKTDLEEAIARLESDAAAAGIEAGEASAVATSAAEDASADSETAAALAAEPAKAGAESSENPPPEAQPSPVGQPEKSPAASLDPAAPAEAPDGVANVPADVPADLDAIQPGAIRPGAPIDLDEAAAKARAAQPSRERVRAPRPRDPSRPAYRVKPSEFVNRNQRRPARSGPGTVVLGVVIALQLVVAALAAAAFYVAVWGRGAPLTTAGEAPRAAPKPADTAIAAAPEAPALAAVPSTSSTPSATLAAPPAPPEPAAPAAPPPSSAPPPAPSAPPPAASAPPSALPAPATPAPRVADLSFPQPPAYGVYALVENKLVELQQVRATPVDPHNAGQLQIIEPGRTVVASGKPAFVIFRRDFASHAPDKVPLRIAAHVAHGMNFDSTGRAIMTAPATDTWIIREQGYDLRASPIEGNSEMIKLRAEDPRLSLPPGRYELMLGGQAYDLTIAGEVTDPAHCVEGVTTVRGQVFNECKPVL